MVSEPGGEHGDARRPGRSGERSAGRSGERALGERERYPDLVSLGVPEGRFVDLPGRGRTFVRESAGPPGAPVIMLLHGLSATAGTNWAGTFTALAERYRVVALDHRGHGQGLRSRHFRLADCADDVVALADELGIDEFVPVGYSMGGPIAQLVWHRHRARVSGMVLCATSRDFRGRIDDRLLFLGVGGLNLGLHGLPRSLGMSTWQAIARVMANGFSTAALRRWCAWELSRNDPRLVCEAALALGSFSSRAWIDSVDVPVAVIATENDQLVPLRRQLKLAHHIPSAVLHPVRGDHFAVTRQPDQFLAALVESCDEVTQRSQRWRMTTTASTTIAQTA